MRRTMVRRNGMNRARSRHSRMLRESQDTRQLVKKVEKYFKGLYDEDLLKDWNAYCEDSSYDDEVYSMDEFDEILDGQSPWDIARAVSFGDFNPNHDYFRFDGYENLESFDHVDDAIDIEELARAVVEDDNDLDDDDLRDILNGE